MALHNPFEKRTEKDKREAIERLNKSVEGWNEAIDKAKKCLESPLFRESQTAARKSILELMEVMLTLPVTDPVDYAFKMQALCNQINALRFLGLSISDIANLPERPTPKLKESASA